MTGRQAGAGPTAGRPYRGPGAEEEQGIHLRRRLGRADYPAIAEVRHALRDMLGGRDRPSTADVAELLTSELVTNALIHTDEGAVVTATVGGSRLRVEVGDSTTVLPGPRMPTADEGTHGRGLFLVQALADAWGVRAQGAGKVVWFELSWGSPQ
ncbi:ATP-binding protein [Streptomyces sannanensis]